MWVISKAVWTSSRLTDNDPTVVEQQAKCTMRKKCRIFVTGYRPKRFSCRLIWTNRIGDSKRKRKSRDVPAGGVPADVHAEPRRRDMRLPRRDAAVAGRGRRAAVPQHRTLSGVVLAPGGQRLRWRVARPISTRQVRQQRHQIQISSKIYLIVLRQGRIHGGVTGVNSHRLPEREKSVIFIEYILQSKIHIIIVMKRLSW